MYTGKADAAAAADERLRKAVREHAASWREDYKYRRALWNAVIEAARANEIAATEWAWELRQQIVKAEFDAERADSEVAALRGLTTR
jgi:hypothetical protein